MSAQAEDEIQDSRHRCNVPERSASRREDRALLASARSGEPALESIRHDAEHRLLASGCGPAVRDRHLAFFLAMAEKLEPLLHGPDQATWADQLELDHDNLRVALGWSRTAPRLELGLRLTTALRYFWYMHGHHRSGREHLANALEHSAGLAPDYLRGRALGAIGYLEAMQAEWGLATAHLEEALIIGRGVNDLPAIALAERYLGFVASGRGDPAAARTHLEASFALYQNLGGADDAGAFLMYLGDAALAEGDHARAGRYFEESSQRLRSLGNTTVLPYPLRRLGHLALLNGDVARAVQLCVESLELNRAVGDPQGVAACLVGLAAAAAVSSAADRAARLLGAADARLAARSIELFPADRQLHEHTTRLVRQQLDQATFTSLWTAGRVADLDAELDELLKI